MSSTTDCFVRCPWPQCNVLMHFRFVDSHEVKGVCSICKNPVHVGIINSSSFAVQLQGGPAAAKSEEQEPEWNI